MRKRGLILATAVVLFPTAPTDVLAQDGFMFGPPKAQLTLRAGPVLHRADGDLLNFFQNTLTLDRRDFRAPSIGGDVSVVVHPRLDVSLGASWSELTSGSAAIATWCEGTEWECTYVDANDNPIEQETSLRVIPVTASVRFYPLSRGEGISSLAWVPARFVPYIGAGGGAAWHRLRQFGRFVDENLEEDNIFQGDMQSTGRSTIGHVLGGVDYWFSSRVGLNAEGRYTFGSGQPGGDFSSWDSIDLSGLQLGIGFSVR